MKEHVEEEEGSEKAWEYQIMLLTMYLTPVCFLSATDQRGIVWIISSVTAWETVEAGRQTEELYVWENSQ